MKTIIASLLILTSVSAMAQDTTTTTTSNDSSSATGGFGIHAGANFSDFDLGSTTANNAKSNKTGWLAGIHFEGFTFAQIFGIRLEGNYSNKGYDVGPFSVTHHYIQIPLLIKVGTPLGPVGVFAEAAMSSWPYLFLSIVLVMSALSILKLPCLTIFYKCCQNCVKPVLCFFNITFKNN